MKRPCIILLACLGVIILSSCGQGGNRIRAPRAEKGKLDLRNWNFESSGPLRLDGTWTMLWQTLERPTDSPPQDRTATFDYDIPSQWGGKKVGDSTIASYGYATFKLRVLLPRAQNLAVKLMDTGPAYELWINHQLIARNGQVGTDRESMRPQYLPLVADVPAMGDTLDLRLLVSNFVLDSGGPWHAVQLGLDEDLHRIKERNLILEYLLFGGILIMAIYHFGLYLLRRSDRTPLYFGFFASCIALRTIIMGERYLIQMFPDLDWAWVVTLEYLTFYLGTPAFILFMASLFPQDFPQRLTRFATGIGLAASLLVLFSSPALFSRTLTFYQLNTIFWGLVVLKVLARALKRKRSGAKTVLGGFLVLFATIINDFLFAQDMIDTMYIAHVGLFIFIFSQAFMLSLKYSRAYTTIELVSKKLEEKNVELTRLDKLKDQFIQNMSHEIRTPLNAIMGFTQLLETNLEDRLGREERDYFTLIHAGNMRLDRTVHLILELSALETGAYTPSPETFCLNATISGVYEEFKAAVSSKDIRFHLDLEADDCQVYADVLAIHKALTQIVDNAIKYTSTGEIRLTLEHLDGKCILTIEDTGIGIPPDYFPRMYQPFSQGSEGNSKMFQGVGLGLCLAKRYLDLFQIELTLANREHGGVVATLVFPPPERLKIPD